MSKGTYSITQQGENTMISLIIIDTILITAGFFGGRIYSKAMLRKKKNAARRKHLNLDGRL